MCWEAWQYDQAVRMAALPVIMTNRLLQKTISNQGR